MDISNEFKRALSETTQLNTSNNRQDLLDYFANLTKWPDPDPPGEIAGKETTSDTVRGGTIMTCTTTEYNIVTNPDVITMYRPSQAALWPGALIQGNGLIKGIGSIGEIPIKKRAPIDVSLNLMLSTASARVNQPDAASVRKAITSLVRGAKSDGGSAVSFRMAETYSFEQAALAAGFSAKFAGSAFKAKHDNKTMAETSVVTVSIIQNCFTAFVSTPATPADFFTSDVSLSDLMEQETLGRIGADNPPAFLSSVTYGRMLYATISSKKSMEEIKTSASAAFAKGKGEFSSEHQKILEESEITISATGITEAAARKLINTGQIAEVFAKPMDLSTAWPLSYVFYNLNDLSIAGIADAAHYAITVCRPGGGKPSETLSRHLDSAGTALREYSRFVLAAVSNWSDPNGRRLRLTQSRTFHAAFADEIRWMDATPHSESDIMWIKNMWVPQTLLEAERQFKQWKLGYDSNYSDPGSRDVYAEAMRYNSSQRILLNGLHAKFAKG